MDKTPGQVAFESYFPHAEKDNAWNKNLLESEKEGWNRSVLAALAHVRPQIEAEARQSENSFKAAVLEALSTQCTSDPAHETDARKAVAALLARNAEMALDPQVSSAAQALIDKARAAAIEDAAILCQNLEEKEILNYGRSIDGNGCANAVAALASAPPGHVCMPVYSEHAKVDAWVKEIRRVAAMLGQEDDGALRDWRAICRKLGAKTADEAMLAARLK
jgi:hypothetical protein